jgi:hypothetical protein
MSYLPYAIIAILIILLIAALVRGPAPEGPGTAWEEDDRAFGVQDDRFLSLSERLFDPSDYLWLRDELGFPHLASVLARSRKQLAIQWLRTLNDSFEALVRTPDPVLSNESTDIPQDSWKLLWLTLRFHGLILYALAVVRLFGPYHRLIPALDWQRYIPVWVPPAQRLRTVRSDRS